MFLFLILMGYLLCYEGSQWVSILFGVLAVAYLIYEKKG